MNATVGLPTNFGEQDEVKAWQASSVGVPPLNELERSMPEKIQERQEKIDQKIMLALNGRTTKIFLNIVAQTTKVHIAKKMIEAALQMRQRSVSAGFDLYKDKQGNNQNGIIAQYYNKQMKKVERVFLGMVIMTTAHTGENIKESVETLLQSYTYVISEDEWKSSPFGSSRTLRENKTLTLLDFVHAATTDNAANVLKAVRLMEIKGVGCGAHKVNLATKMALGGKLPRSGHPDYTPDPYDGKGE
jgi:hypothetical protein